MIGTKIANYEIEARLGAGGMGEVYRARDTKLKRDVALKVLPDVFAHDSERMVRFQREAEVLASLNHPNIAAIYGVEERALVMELVDGETLPNRLPLDSALRYAKQIAEALEYAHERGVVHRDLKPANVKVTAEGTVKLLDFGLAKAIEDPASSDNDPGNSPTLTLGATRVGVILGTAGYMSPEQASGKSADRRSDIWSFGVVLYEMLSGKPAFHGESVSDSLASVLKVDPDWSALPPSTPASIRTLVQRCLTKDRKQRLQAIGEARIAIERQLTTPDRDVELAQANKRPSRLPLILAASALALALAIVSFLHFRETRPPQQVLRYTLAMPENTVAKTFAVSPDGRFVVMSASVNGKYQLWLRALGELEWQPMPFTEDAGYPFWSPDSRNIGFVAQGKLKRIAVGGGPAQTLCAISGTPSLNVGEFLGASWNRDDVILFQTRGESNGIQRVSASGGNPITVIKGDGVYRLPTFLPDGRHFLYSKGRFQTLNKNAVYWSSSDGIENRAILEDAAAPVFEPSTPGSADGYLLFVRQDTLMAQRFNGTRGELSGGEFPVLEGVAVNPRGPYTPAVVSENGVLVYWNSAAEDSTEIVWIDRAGRRNGSVGLTGHIAQPTISPDEKTIALSRGSGTTSDLWLWDIVRGTGSRLTNNGVRNNDPLWSPLGDRISFRSELNRSPGDIYQKPTNGIGQDGLLLTTPANKIPSQWSRDGKYIVYSSSTPSTSWDIWLLPVSQSGGADAKPVEFLQTTSWEVQGQLSPDSQWMAYASNESGQPEIYVRPFPASTPVWKVSTAGGVQPRWRGDGKELFFVAPDAKMMAVSIKAAPGPKPSFEPGTPVPLFDVHVDDVAIAYRYDVTRDGNRFLVETALSSVAPRMTVWSNWTAALKK
jgi:serine/threonine protein kinase/Tol biopolymer transport system component